MKIIPMDIVRKNFGRRFMGFSPEEVMEFLSFVAAEMEGLMRERNNLRDTLREKEMSVVEFRQREEVLKNTISTASMMSDKMKKDAEREARLIINDANQKADIITRDARDSLKRIYNEVTDLKKIRLQYENNLRALISSHLTMMEQGQKIMPDPHVNSQVASDADGGVTELTGPSMSSALKSSAPNDPNTNLPKQHPEQDSFEKIRVNVSESIKEKVENIDI